VEALFKGETTLETEWQVGNCIIELYIYAKISDPSKVLVLIYKILASFYWNSHRS